MDPRKVGFGQLKSVAEEDFAFGEITTGQFFETTTKDIAAVVADLVVADLKDVHAGRR